jgi:hypothetical protein
MTKSGTTITSVPPAAPAARAAEFPELLELVSTVLGVALGNPPGTPAAETVVVVELGKLLPVERRVPVLVEGATLVALAAGVVAVVELGTLVLPDLATLVVVDFGTVVVVVVVEPPVVGGLSPAGEKAIWSGVLRLGLSW